METAKIAAPINGDKLYQVRARQVLPLLVRQAKAQNTITYLELANEVGMPNARNLNYVLGSIGRTLQNLSKHWKEIVPPIQCVVVNKQTNFPGNGVGWFIGINQFSRLSKENQKAALRSALADVYTYRRWDAVLRKLGLLAATGKFEPMLNGAANLRGTGEGEAHKKLKQFIAGYPKSIGLEAHPDEVSIEFPLPSGDRVDVLFRYGERLIAVEVKPENAPASDVTRGLFQCIKYQVVLEADQSLREVRHGVSTLLAIGGKLTADQVGLGNALDVEVVQEIAKKSIRRKSRGSSRR